ncbi:MAG: ABC transporter substrate-binding protein [Ancrocorticia sp.]
MRRSFIAVLAAGALALSACGGNTDSGSEESPAAGATTPAAEATEAAPTSVEFEDNNGKHTIDVPLKSVVATDNRTFQTLADWDIKLSAAAVGLMPDTVKYVNDTSVVDLGNHGEPDLEAVVAVEPDLIITGQRFTQFSEDFAKLAPEATIVNLDPREGEPFDSELKRQITVMGEIFGKQAEAKKLTDDFDAAIARVKAAYKAEDKVMAVITSGGEIGYVAPGAGRTLGPVFDFVGLTPALETEGSDDHQGDDVSVEAIADSNPDWILVMDRDAAINSDDPTFKPGNEILEGSEALANVPAVQNKHILYMPADTYLNEGIQTYTKFLNEFADALEKAK